MPLRSKTKLAAMTVVILDTNALPRGHYNDRALNGLFAIEGVLAASTAPAPVTA